MVLGCKTHHTRRRFFMDYYHIEALQYQFSTFLKEPLTLEFANIFQSHDKKNVFQNEQIMIFA